MPGVCTPCKGVYHVHVDTFCPYFGQCFIICSRIIGLVGPIFIHFCLLIINLIKLTPLIRRSLFHFYRLNIMISLFIVVVLFVVLFYFLFVCFFVGGWFLYLITDCGTYIFFKCVYRSMGLYLSFKIFCEYHFSSSFCHYTLNHSEWTNENTFESCLFSHFNEKMFGFCLFFSSLIAYPKPTTNLCRSTYNPPKKKGRKHQKERQKQRNITITRQSSLIQ